ncbi:PKD domain-containing protein [Cryobacterium psychrophilum]|uniref:PKD domain-containing protein n=1 Tax=Cryobacterium psychrophilum TaxID=41988 RepID=A0A4Y8KRF7_9MICO|nr:PKD domain-containing protein [Cryobacterium psychrophilum]
MRLRVLAVATTLALLATLAWASLPAQADSAPVDPGVPSTVAADALPTVQINGVVWAQLIVGNTVYVGGEFTRARPAGSAPGVNEVVRNNLLAYNLTTGVMTSFNPNLNAAVQALVASPDGSRIYVGGTFTKVGAVNRYRVAAFSTDGELVSPWNPGTNARVSALAVTGSTLYLAGAFSNSGNQTRNGMSAFSTATGALLPWTGQPTGGRVTSLAVSPDEGKVILGGTFTAYNGGNNPGYGLAAADAATGASLPWKVNTLIRNGGRNAGITSLTASAEGLFGTGYVYGSGGNFEGTFRASWADGTLIWVEDCHGDTYSAAPATNVVYTTGHVHYCGNIGGFPETSPRSWQRTLTFTMKPTGVVTANAVGNYFNYAGNPRPSLLAFYSDINTGVYTGQGQGPWNVVANSQYVLYGGEFTIVNNKSQQGLVRFAVAAIAPNKEGPRVSDVSFVPSEYKATVASFVAGQARVTWQTAYDRDNENLSYEVLRDNVPVTKLTAASVYWKRPSLDYTDTGLTPGNSYSYRIRVTDPFGNAVTGEPVSVTVTNQGAVSAYAGAVLQDSPRHYWPLGEANGTTGFDWAASNDVSTGSGVTRNVAGAVGAGTASRFNGTSTGFAATSTPETAMNSFSLEAWVKTSSKTGGKIIGFGNDATGQSTSYDRHVYMDNNGKIWFGVYPGAVTTVTSAASYNDNAWHHVVATLGANGLALFVDGTSVGTLAGTTAGEGPYEGYWRIGGDTLAGWPGAYTSAYLAADIDEVAVYDAPLTTERIAYHSTIGRGGTPQNVPPTAAFEAVAGHLSVTTDASASTDPDGTITSYAWSWGDGATSTGKTASHGYASAGIYTVGLTVTDNAGGTNATTRSVTTTVAPVNAAPTAAFTATVAPLSVAVDGRASTDADGTIKSFDWSWGDGTTGTGVTATHAYAAAGNYPIRLTVTDNAGATGTTEQTANVPAPPADPNASFAADAFERTVSDGLGRADTGGDWSATGNTSDYAVSGGVGRLTAPGPGATVNSFLSGVSSANTEVTVTTALQQATTGGGTYVSVIARRVGNDDYRARVKVLSTGVVQLHLLRGGTTLSAATVSGLTYATGDALQVRVQAFGTSPTTLRAKVWKAGTTEPTGWQLTATDAAAALQTPGSIGLAVYLSGSATAAPLTAAFDNLVARAAE